MKRKVVQLQVTAIVQLTDDEGNVVDMEPKQAILHHPMVEKVERFIYECEKEVSNGG